MSAESPIHAAPVSAKSLKVREARFEDYSDVIALESKFHLASKSYEDWTHLWVKNPAYRDAEDRFPIGWVLQNEDGAISGYLGNIPLNYQFEGANLLAATTRSWVVDTAYRPHSLLLLATYFKQPNVDLFLNTTVNSQAANAFSALQGVPVPVGAWDRSLFWITHYRGFTESFLRKRGASMAKPLSYPFSAGVFFRDQFGKKRLTKNGNRTRVIPCARFDDRFDAFWEALKKKKSQLLLAVRTREVLEWHFTSALLRNAAWIYTVEGDSGLLAYAVFVRQDNPDSGLTRVRLADFQCLEEGSASAFFTAMLRAASDRCRQESIHMLELIGLSPALETEAEGLYPHRRQLPNWMYFYRVNQPSLGERLKSATAWEPSLFDGDSSL